MPTPTEKRALGFFAVVLLLGAGVRVLRAAGGSPVAPDAQARVALHQQIEAVDSARRAGGGRRGARGGGRHRGASRTTGDGAPAPTTHGGVWQPESAPPRVYYLRSRQPVGRLGRDSIPPPFMAPSESGPARAPTALHVDVEVATAVELERLPRIGPALAQRIVADRAANGPYGSLEALTRVRGIGAATARLLAPYVTFSLTPRLSGEGEVASGAAGGRGRRLRKPRSP